MHINYFEILESFSADREINLRRFSEKYSGISDRNLKNINLYIKPIFACPVELEMFLTWLSYSMTFT